MYEGINVRLSFLEFWEARIDHFEAPTSTCSKTDKCFRRARCPCSTTIDCIIIRWWICRMSSLIRRTGNSKLKTVDTNQKWDLQLCRMSQANRRAGAAPPETVNTLGKRVLQIRQLSQWKRRRDGTVPETCYISLEPYFKCSRMLSQIIAPLELFAQTLTLFLTNVAGNMNPQWLRTGDVLRFAFGICRTS